MFLVLLDPDPVPLVRGTDPDPRHWLLVTLSSGDTVCCEVIKLITVEKEGENFSFSKSILLTFLRTINFSRVADPDPHPYGSVLI
jgi:hypothetical protein